MTDLTIRRITTADMEAASLVLTEGYGSTFDWTPELLRYLALQPDGWLMAEIGGEPVGSAGTLDYGPFAHVGLVAVRPEFRRRGAALALMRHLLAWLDERGCPSATLDATEVGTPLYAAVGFAEVERTVRYLLDDCPVRPRVGAGVAPMAEADLADVAAFDAPIFGARRDAVLAALLRESPGRAFVARDAGGAVEGFLVAQQRIIGPWAAHTPELAEGLLGAALRLEYAGQARATVPAANPAVARLLMRYGFSPHVSLRHMRRGPPLADRRELLYSQASLAIG